MIKGIAYGAQMTLHEVASSLALADPDAERLEQMLKERPLPKRHDRKYTKRKRSNTPVHSG